MKNVRWKSAPRYVSRRAPRWRRLAPFLLVAGLFLAGCRTPVAGDADGETGRETAARNRERLLKYLKAEEGKRILSGQMDTAWSDSIDMVARVYKDTGKYPALKGFDFINIRNPNWGGGGSKQTREAIAWWKNAPIRGKNGVVTFCWHWRMPKNGVVRGNGDTYEPGFAIPFKDGRLDREDPKFSLIQEDLDLVAAEFAALRDAGVPLLWRPLHEASGGWFWWGANRDAYLALWAYMYDYFTNDKGLDNLIWVWNGQKGDWYPDSDTVDVAGYDAYDDNRNKAGYIPNYNEAWRTRYIVVKAWAPDKILALTENGAMPDPDALIFNNAKWSYFMTWNDHGVASGVSHKDNYWTGEWHNSDAHKKHVYNHAFVITLDELPVLSTYRLE
ncbi:MAG: glycoside hydrolase family 26 protein [Treponema sp.]|jgi:mannan endo-1,4-beta-mannosidase|nr:glycoside hydrolase family 26 protein [Treponema sp.]